MTTMSEEEKPGKPDPIEDVRKGLGLLFRAAKSAIDQLPTRGVEDAVLTGAREVGRAIENVTSTLDKQFFRRDPGTKKVQPPGGEEGTSTTSDGSGTSGAAAGSDPATGKPPHDPPNGPRVG
jgi:hypothetical protein